ncbi:hypothetical protein GCM10009720_20540 [Yaniella flava]|uniref:Integral membrane protein n=1 Tax=Yaniella flava TaxID=287930 RepID=A0ABN2UNG9_9MICC
MSDIAVPNSRVSGVARLARGWVVAVLAVLFAAGGHQAAHSMMHGSVDAIPVELLVFSVAITAPIAVALAGKRISTWSTMSATVIGQFVFHGLYSLPYTGVPTVQDPHGHHHGHLPGLEEHTAHAVHSHGGAAIHSSAAADIAMLLAHIAAAVLTTGATVFGERCLVAIVGWLLLVPPRLVLATQPVSMPRPKTIQPVSRTWIPSPIDPSQTCSTRGPPVCA